MLVPLDKGIRSVRVGSTGPGEFRRVSSIPLKAQVRLIDDKSPLAGCSGSKSQRGLRQRDILDGESVVDDHIVDISVSQEIPGFTGEIPFPPDVGLGG